MRSITVTGHLGNDPELKTTSNGRQYTTFRLANHEYTDAEGVTYWYTVTVWDSGLQKWCQSLKKGSNVYVIGLPTDRTYKSTKTGTDEIGRDIRANDVGFIGGNKRDDDVQAGQTAPAQEAPINESAPVQKAPAKAKPAKATNTVSTPVAEPASDGADDDLPF